MTRWSRIYFELLFSWRGKRDARLPDLSDPWNKLSERGSSPHNALQRNEAGVFVGRYTGGELLISVFSV